MNTVIWNNIKKDGLPPDTLFWPCWVYTNDGRVMLTRYITDEDRVDEDTINGFVRGGIWFDNVTHWASLEFPEPPK